MSKNDVTVSTTTAGTAHQWGNGLDINRTWIGDPLPGTNINDIYTYPYNPGDWNTTISPNSTSTVSVKEIERLLQEMEGSKGTTNTGRARIDKSKKAGRALAERLNGI